MDIYAQNILDHYKNPRHKEPFNNPEAALRELNATCGDDLSVELSFSGPKVKEIKWQGEGCAISQAAMSILSDALVGRSRSQIAKYGFKELRDLLGIDISERRANCALLGLKAIQKACCQA